MCKIKNNLFIVQEKLKQYNYNKNKIFYSSNPSVRQDCEAHIDHGEVDHRLSKTLNVKQYGSTTLAEMIDIDACNHVIIIEFFQIIFFFAMTSNSEVIKEVY
uniref:Uncharacterized protein n=1 Tax=Rhizophagus irregularis (strain DAOM 181602 / DAOM 197198 / MUCL 43194) TaxID=747089 RepID=U9SY67_RHIID